MTDMSDAASPHIEPKRGELIEQPIPLEREDMLTNRLSRQFGIEGKGLVDVIRKNIISIPEGDSPATKEELFLVMSTMEQYGLNPFVRQIYAFRSKGKLVISIPMDGWVILAKRERTFRGVEYEFPLDERGNMKFITTKGGKKCWEWVKAVCHVEGRQPTVAFAFLEEWYVPSGRYESNWAKHPRHRLKMKAYGLAVREAFGISLYDDVDAEQFRFMESKESQLAEGASVVSSEIHSNLDKARAYLDSQKPSEADVEPVEEDEPAPVVEEPQEPSPAPDTVDKKEEELTDEDIDDLFSTEGE